MRLAVIPVESNLQLVLSMRHRPRLFDGSPASRNCPDQVGARCRPAGLNTETKCHGLFGPAKLDSATLRRSRGYNTSNFVPGLVPVEHTSCSLSAAMRAVGHVLAVEQA